MDINGIVGDYYRAGYTNNKATKAETGKTFAEIASQKVAEAKKNSTGKDLCYIGCDWSKCT